MWLDILPEFCYVHSSNGAERNATVMGTLQFLEPFNISPFRSAPLRSVPESLLVHSSNGAERFWQWWEHCNFSSHSISPLRSVPESLLRSQFQRSGAECFWQWWEHCNFSSQGLLIHKFGRKWSLSLFSPTPFPLRSAPYQNHCYVHSSNGETFIDCFISN